MSTDHSTVFQQILDNRRSVRAYTERVADQVLLQQIFQEAQRAPSNCNTQPWYTAVVSGERCRSLGNKLQDALNQGLYQMDFPYLGSYEGIYKERQHGAASELYSSMEIAREDKAARHEAFMRNFDFFGAPHAAFLFLPEQFGIREAADLGMYAQTLMLSLSAHGLASCPQTALSFACDTVREELGVDSSMKLMFGISFGYEDKEYPANTCRVGRAELDQSVQFIK
ncbi:nitroreductase [Endozoicomonas numazuensis]|uniref:Nitroreductase n=1 Tax=Endozoicomonas numazuensis TaxID=1137799 RepID=A0A081NMJ2_9GAMM|nr:nitroreductase [Endozoicomonas numazuensis]KEQ19665.1 nitroreductase [Endozoicomonas numazuensis]